MDPKELFARMKQFAEKNDSAMDKHFKDIDKRFGMSPGESQQMTEGLVSGIGMGGLATKLVPTALSKLKDLAVAGEGKIAGLPEMSKLRELMSSPTMQNLREPIRAERNIRLGKQESLIS